MTSPLRLDRPKRPRWLLYGTTLAVTVAVTAWVQLDHKRAVPAVAVAVGAAVPPTQVPSGTAPTARPDSLMARNALQVPMQGAQQPATQPGAASAPALPFSYAGHWSEGKTITVLLRHGATTLTVRQPGPLGDGYAVDSIDAERIVISHPASQTRQAVPLRAAPAMGPSVAMQSASQAPSLAPGTQAASPAHSQSNDTEDQGN